MLTVTAASAQTAYRPAYLVDDAGQRQTVDILDRDWVDNPRRFKYRLGDQQRDGSLATVREFGYADGSLRYLRAVVDIDQSSEQANKLSIAEQPEYRRDTVFLEWLVDGNADLFYYETGELRRFFYRLGDGEPLPLINRRYRKGQHIIQQQVYRGQLRSAVNCGNADTDLRGVTYERKALVDYFETFHACEGTDYQVALRKAPDRPLHFSVRPGGEWYTGYMGSTSALGLRSEYSLNQTTGFRIGVEAEYVIPLRNESWRIFSEVYYHQVRGVELKDDSREVTINLRSVNVPLGVRAYLPLSTSWSVFLNAGGVLQFPWKSFVARRVSNNYFDYDATWNFGILGGAGVEIRKRFLLEARYQYDQDVLQHYIDHSTHFRVYSLVAGYRLP